MLREINTKSTRAFERSCDGWGQRSCFQPPEAGGQNDKTDVKMYMQADMQMISVQLT